MNGLALATNNGVMVGPELVRQARPPAIGKFDTLLSSYSGDNEWYTPAKYIEMAREVLGTTDVDPASNATAQKTVRAATHYTVDNSGLDKEWRGRVWMNPPYSRPEINRFADKLLAELSAGRTEAAIVLTNNSGDTAWHQALAGACKAICVTRGRIKFESPTRASKSPPAGQSFFYFGPDAVNRLPILTPDRRPKLTP